jgi:hypothetical protein
MSSTALSRLLTARAKALTATALPISKPIEQEFKIVAPPVLSGFVKATPRPPPIDSDLTTIWNSGEIIAERLVLGRKVVVTYCVNKN